MDDNDPLGLVRFEGNIPEITRVSTGIHSLDISLSDRGDLGIPLRSVYELYGGEHSGKSTLALYLATLPRGEGKIAYLDLEYALDKDWALRALANSGFTGVLHAIDDSHEKKKEVFLKTHASMAEEAKDLLITQSYTGIIVDSLGMWVPVLETKAKVGESVIGRRAMEIGQFTRKCLGALRVASFPKIVMMVNHVLPKIGGQGHYTPGGKAKGYGANARLYMWRSDNQYDGGCFEATVKIEKLRYGGKQKGRDGYVFIIPHKGVSKEFTWLLDCIRYGLVTSANGWIGRPGVKKKMRKGEYLEAAIAGERKPFEPFRKLLFEPREDTEGPQEQSSD